MDNTPDDIEDIKSNQSIIEAYDFKMGAGMNTDFQSFDVPTRQNTSIRNDRKTPRKHSKPLHEKDGHPKGKCRSRHKIHLVVHRAPKAGSSTRQRRSERQCLCGGRRSAPINTRRNPTYPFMRNLLQHPEFGGLLSEAEAVLGKMSDRLAWDIAQTMIKEILYSKTRTPFQARKSTLLSKILTQSRGENGLSDDFLHTAPRRQTFCTDDLSS